MEVKDLSLITERGYIMNPIIENNKTWDVVGFDTETYNGKVTLIADSIGDYKTIDNVEDLLKFVLQGKYRKTINFFFNLEYDANAIIKWLPEKNIKEIIYYNESTVKFKDFAVKIFNIPKKCLKISYLKTDKDKGKGVIRHTVKFFDIMSFYQYGGLVQTYNRVFPNKNYVKSMDATKGFKYEEIDDSVIKYCKEDASICYELAYEFVKMCNKIVSIRNYYSPASIAKALIKKNMIESYLFKKSPIQNYALHSYAGGRFEVVKRGYFDNLYMYDINSAYPSIILDLYEPKGIIKSDQQYRENSIYSFFLIDVDMPEIKITPLKYFLSKENILAFPNGKLNKLFLTKKEYEVILKHDIKHRIISAKHYLDENPNKPFEWVKEIYNLRQNYKKGNDRRELILKLALNSIYGSFIQTTKKYSKISPNKIDSNIKKEFIEELDDFIYCDKCGYEVLNEDGEYSLCPDCGYKLSLLFRKKEYVAGGFYNPIYATTITANVRVKLFEDAIKNNLMDNVVMFATDSITFDKKVKHLPLSRKLGEWDLIDNLEGLIIGSGIYSLKDKNDKIISSKQRFRGFGKEDVLTIAEQNRHKEVYKYIKSQSPYKLKESKNDLNKINVFHDKERCLALNFDKKRKWEYEAKTFNDLLENQIDSMPLTIDDG